MLATNTWNRFQAGCIHYNGKPNISAVSILNKISPTDDNELLLQPGGYARDQASNPVKHYNSYAHATIRNFEIPFNTRLQRRHFNERNNIGENSVSTKQEFPDQLSKCCLVLRD